MLYRRTRRALKCTSRRRRSRRRKAEGRRMYRLFDRSGWILTVASVSPTTLKVLAHLLSKSSVQKTGLPLPSVVNSGNGLYAHWILEEDIDSCFMEGDSMLTQKYYSDLRLYVRRLAHFGLGLGPAPGGDEEQERASNPKDVRLLAEGKNYPLPYLSRHPEHVRAQRELNYICTRVLEQISKPGFSPRLRRPSKQRGTNQREMPAA